MYVELFFNCFNKVFVCTVQFIIGGLYLVHFKILDFCFRLMFICVKMHNLCLLVNLREVGVSLSSFCFHSEMEL